jgi:hypothetical protein
MRDTLRRAAQPKRLGQLEPLGPATPRSRRSLPRDAQVDSSATSSRGGSQPQPLGLQYRLRLACRARSPLHLLDKRPTISDASDCGLASAVDTVSINRPPRGTVTRSETAFTSGSLCEIKITAPLGDDLARLEQRRRLVGRSTAVGRRGSHAPPRSAFRIPERVAFAD